MTALMLIFRVKRPEIDEICCNSSYLCVNWWDSIKYKQTSYIVQSIWERLVANLIFLRKLNRHCLLNLCDILLGHASSFITMILLHISLVCIWNNVHPFTYSFWSTALVYHLLEYQLLYFFLSYWHITLFHIHSLLILKHISLYLPTFFY
jgi:hypothetical protein